MRRGRLYEENKEAVEILDANRFGGSDVVASDVMMAIYPLRRTPQELAQSGRAPYTPRFGAIVGTPNDELKRNRQIRRADTTVMNIVEVYDALGEQQLVLEATGTP